MTWSKDEQEWLFFLLTVVSVGKSGITTEGEEVNATMESEGFLSIDRLMATSSLRPSCEFGVGELYSQPVRRQREQHVAGESAEAEQRFPGATAAAS